MRTLNSVLALVAGALALSVAPVEANNSTRTIKVCSSVSSNKCATGLVRTTDVGQQVQLPGGTWVHCFGDCREKLRKKTVDYWHEQMLQF